MHPPKIRRLPESLVSKIAAGEVIERPFSVVKELVENSLDAGSKNIEVEIEDGGRKRMTILDDGIGMTKDEALLALERHATSKLASEEDLFRIQTLGFRGEALPSIAAISYMTLETRRSDSEEAASKIEIQGGTVVKVGLSSLPIGTRITIENLFFNTPARLKFMKSKETEFSHIASWMESIALSRTDIGFSLKHQGKTELKTPPREDVKDRIRDILGMDIAEFLHPVSANRGQLKMAGFAADHRASASGGSAKSVYFFVNGRIVRDRTLQHAVSTAYENLLMKHRYPWVVLYLTVPPEFVDVNVHPTKSEVRFANSSLMHELVREGIRQALQGPKNETVGANLVFAPQDATNGVGAQFTAPGRDPAGLAQLGESRSYTGEHKVRPYQQTIPHFNFRVLGQVHGTYLLCETADKLILIDQHAAHERIGFEKLHAQYESGGIEKQQLLIPQNFDLRPSQCEILKKYVDDLARVGLEVAFFGGNTFIVRSIPTLLDGTDIVALVHEIVDGLESFEKLTPLEERIHEVLERMACHRQVRAGDRLSNEEIEALLKEMGSTRFAGQCPHGRPSVLEISFDEIEKWFKRRL